MCIEVSTYIKKHPLKSLAAISAVSVLFYKIARFTRSPSDSKTYILIENSEQWLFREDEILRNIYKTAVVGFDCEWVTENDKRSPISLLQLANEYGFCVIIRLPFFTVSTIPLSLINLLNDETMLKVGVGIAEDVDKLFSDYSLQVNRFLDLRFLAQNMNDLQGKSLSLKSLAFEFLGEILNKDNCLRCSDWNAVPLSHEQILYAAEDAIVSAKIFCKIKKVKSNFPWYTCQFSDELELLVNIPFKNPNSKTNQSKCLYKSLNQSPKLRYSKPLQKPMYDNCQLVAPDGELLCSCDRGKAEWYVFKDLGKKICDEPFTVCLNFEPSGRPRLDNVFYTMEKSNQCVVCGSTNNLHRKFVVPSEYRKYFPDIMKKNLSHDVLLLCQYCHKRSNVFDQQMRVKLTVMCNAPLGCKKNVKYKFDSQLAKVKSAAKALVLSDKKIPDLRRQELLKMIADYYAVDLVTKDILDEAQNLNTTLFNSGFTPHGLKVYQYFCKNEGLINFEKMWRQHFLDTMYPKFLPTLWSVEHNHKRLAMQIKDNERDIDFDVSILGLDFNCITNQ